MKRVAGFVELFTQKVPAVRAGHKKLTLTDSESINAYLIIIPLLGWKAQHHEFYQRTLYGYSLGIFQPFN